MKDDAIIDAQTLAIFANLTSEGFEYFQQNYPDFVPTSLWAEQSGVMFTHRLSASDPQTTQQATTVKFIWAETIQKALQAAWRSGFPTAESISLIGMGGHVPLNLGLKVTPEVAEMLKRMGKEFEFNVYGFQKAVMFLHVQAWRAAFCPKCGIRFVKTKPQQKFCTDKCFNEGRAAYKRKLWQQHGEEWRQQTAKQSRRSKKRAKPNKRKA
jgi:hypothetical protein